MPFCKFCNSEIMWIKDGRKNVPINMDASKHQCEQMKNSIRSVKKFDRSSLSPEEIAKYENLINNEINKKKS